MADSTHPEQDDDRTLRTSDFHATSDSGRFPTGPEPPPRMIGGYRIERELGRGGMGIVYEAVEERLGRRVALKVMTSRAWTETGSLERFRREAAMTSRLDHRGICQVYAAGAHDGLPFIAMQYVDGRSLADRIKEEPPPSDRAAVLEAALIAEQAAEALHEAHEASVTHRDVKPGNIMVSSDGRAVVLDFGLARMDDAELPTLTQEGDIFGTPAYMSPERLGKDGTVVDRRCDVYALGAVLYELLTGERPFRAPTHQALFKAILEEEPVPIRKLNAHVPPDLAVVIGTALEKNPDRRYATAEAFAQDLARIRRHEPISARPPSVFGRIRRWTERRPAAAALILVIALAVAATGVLGGWLLAELPQAERAKEQARLDAIARELEVGFLAYNEARWPDALASFESVLDTGVHTAEAGLALALSHLRMKAPGRALEVLDALPRAVSDTTAFRLVRHDTLKLLDRPDEAATAIADLPPPSTPLDYFLAGLRLTTRPDRENLELSLKYFTRAALHLRHARALFHQQRGYVALRLGDGETLEEVGECLETLYPDSAHTWVFKAYLLSGAPIGETHVSGGLVHATDAHGAGLRHLRDLPRALKAWERALEIDPDSVSALVNIGVTLHAMGRTDAAIDHFEAATRKIPHLAVVWFNLGLARARAKDREGAFAAWDEALEIDPVHLLTLRSYAAALRRVDARRARAMVDRTLETYPTDSKTLVWDGVLHIDAGDRDAAEDAWLAAVESDPRNGRAHENLGLLYMEAGDHEASAHHFGRAYEISGGRNLALVHKLATGHYKAGTPEKAIPIVEDAVARARSAPGIPDETVQRLESLLKALRQRAARKSDDDGDGG